MYVPGGSHDVGVVLSGVSGSIRVRDSLKTLTSHSTLVVNLSHSQPTAQSRLFET